MRPEPTHLGPDDGIVETADRTGVETAGGLSRSKSGTAPLDDVHTARRPVDGVGGPPRTESPAEAQTGRIALSHWEDFASRS